MSPDSLTCHLVEGEMLPTLLKKRPSAHRQPLAGIPKCGIETGLSKGTYQQL